MEEDKMHHEFMQSSISNEKMKVLQRFAKHDLGPDESSSHFLSREKAIAFVYVENGQVFRLDQDYFIQNSSYNDFSGGYKRSYKLIPKEIINTAAGHEILRFKNYFHIPDKTPMLVQIQSSFAAPCSRKGTVTKRRLSITGQGIHSDGHDHAMLLCIERTNVHGAGNSFFSDLEGNNRLGDTRLLEEKDLVYFHDNEIYHHVSPASQIDHSAWMRRSMMLIHSPAEMVVDGRLNDSNKLSSNKAKIQLRSK